MDDHLVANSPTKIKSKFEVLARMPSIVHEHVSPGDEKNCPLGTFWLAADTFFIEYLHRNFNLKLC